MSILKKATKESSKRTQYEDHSNQFLNWVNELGFEKTRVGNFLFQLEEKFRLRRLFLVTIFAFILSILITMNFDFVYTGYKRGDVVGSDIKSPISFEYVDEIETALKKKNAEDLVPPVYDYDLNAYEHVIKGVYKSFRKMREYIGKKPWPNDPLKRDEKIKDFMSHKDEFDQLLGTSEIPPKLFEGFTENRFSVLYENIIIRLLDRISGQKIIHDLNRVGDVEFDRIMLRVVEGGGEGEEFTSEIKDIKQLFEAREEIKLDGIRGAQYLNDKDKTNLIKFVQRLVIPNLTPNKQETANRRLKAREAIPQVIVSIQKNQIVVSSGTVIQPYHERVLDEISKRDTRSHRDFQSLVLAFFFVSILLVFFSYIRRFSLNKIRISSKDLMIMGTVAIILTLICKFMFFLAVETLQDRMGFIPTSVYRYILPVSAGPMLIGLLVYSGEVVWLFTIFLSVALAFMMDLSFPYFIFITVGGIAAARWIHSCKKRNDIYLAGLRVGIVNALIITLMTFLSTKVDDVNPVFYQILWNAIAGFLSGIFASFVTMTIVPLLESAFNCTTDVKLLELSNLNHPLLKKMSVQALGTYHHSLVVGSMVEAAAEAIGSNPLLARVAAYYHDIGKIDHANYFIENQRPGHNPHDQLSPHMSRTILVAHVKDGVDLGLKYKLGKPIIDIIQQHHGTTLISYFYNKALENQDEDLHEISEDDFRYPGPKPQFKEAALCMLADGVEAAARVLEEPHPMRIKNLVKTIIQRKFMDGQLEDCNLTLRDLSIIESCFVRVLMGIYHQRVDYPKSMGGISSK